eukprot:s2835_g7.t1
MKSTGTPAQEFCNHVEDPWVQAFLSGLDIDISDARIVFTLLDVDGSGSLTVEDESTTEFVDGAMKLKGPAKGIEPPHPDEVVFDRTAEEELAHLSRVTNRKMQEVTMPSLRSIESTPADVAAVVALQSSSAEECATLRSRLEHVIMAAKAAEARPPRLRVGMNMVVHTMAKEEDIARLHARNCEEAQCPRIVTSVLTLSIGNGIVNDGRSNSARSDVADAVAELRSDQRSLAASLSAAMQSLQASHELALQVMTKHFDMISRAKDELSQLRSQASPGSQAGRNRQPSQSGAMHMTPPSLLGAVPDEDNDAKEGVSDMRPTPTLQLSSPRRDLPVDPESKRSRSTFIRENEEKVHHTPGGRFSLPELKAILARQKTANLFVDEEDLKAKVRAAIGEPEYDATRPKALVVMAAAVRAEGSGSMDPGAFLQALPGSWEGFAVQTPLGRMPYNLDFRVLDDRSVKGVSPTNGVAVHTWSFKESQDKEGLPQLSLNFHSTFGNSFATGLVATSVDADKGMKFSGGQPEKLEVWVRLDSTLSQETWQAEILLDGNPHVSISALRPKKACSGS